MDEIAERHDRDHWQLDLAKAEFARRNPVPFELDFGDGGTIVVHEVALEGFTGRAEFWLRYSWVNTTGGAVDAGHVTFSMVDPESGFEAEEEMELKPPLLSWFGPDSTYTTYVRVMAGDARLSGRLMWEIRAHAQGPDHVPE